MLLTSITFGILSSASYAAAAVIPHSDVVGFPGQLSGIAEKFQPLIKVINGCVPYPAVSRNGDVSGGLKPSGGQSSDCSTSPGQVYVRQGTYGGDCAIMYASFFPKDQNNPGFSSGSHRYDWENVIVWLPRCSITSSIKQVSYSAHGDYVTVSSPPLSGNRPLVLYSQNPYPLNHSFSPTNMVGGSTPGIMWEQLTPAARNTLSTFDFGSATVPLKDSKFMENLQKAHESQQDPDPDA